MQFGLPPFQGALRNLIIATTVIYVGILILLVGQRELAEEILRYGSLSTAGILHGEIWQFFTYGFLHVDPWNFVLTMVGVFFLGSAVQERIGSRAFLELYISSLVGAGVLGFLFSLTGVIGQGGAMGAGAAVNAILMVFYLMNREAPIMLFPLPIQIPVKYIVIAIAGIEAAYFIIYHYPLLFLVSLLGLFTGFLWYKMAFRRRTVSGAIEERVFGLRNSYYRWKRRRAARKFQVYMNKHEHDPKKYFDEYGNFKPPDDSEKKNGGGKGGWVN